MKKNSILKSDIVQTIGSAGESLAAGGVIWLLIDGERLIDEVRAENIGCEYGEYC